MMRASTDVYTGIICKFIYVCVCTVAPHEKQPAKVSPRVNGLMHTCFM